MGNCNNQNNNSEHLSLSWEIVYICKVVLNSLSLTTSKYKAFGTTTTKTIEPAHCLQNLQKYKKCLNSYTKKCLAIVCHAIVYK